MKAAYKWVLNNNVSAYIVSESEAAPFLYYINEDKRVYEDSEIIGIQINEEAISLTVNNIKTTEDYDNLYNRLKDLVEAKERIILPSDSSQFYSIDGLGCKRSNVGISVEIESVEDGPLGVTAVTEGVASMQKIKFDFNIPIGQQGEMGDYRKVSSARDYIDDSAESGVTAIIKENGEYDLSFILHNGAQGDKGPQGVRGIKGQSGFPFYVNPKGHTSNETGVQQWLENVGANDQRYALDFSLKRGTQGDLGEEAGVGEDPINSKDYDDGVVHEEKIYLVSDYNATTNITKPTVMYFGDVLIYPNKVEQLDYTDLSFVDVISGNITDTQETANCYVVKETGLYEIPLVYGCAIKDGKENSSSYTQISGQNTQPFYNYKDEIINSPFIEIDTQTSAVTVQVLGSDSGFQISDFAIVNKHVKIGTTETCKYLRFSVTSIPEVGGNARLVIKDGEGKIIWSWHIWAYPFDLNTLPLTTTVDKTIFALEVNLGFVRNNVNTKYGTSLYYQWGRKDPIKRLGSSESLYTLSTICNGVQAAIRNPGAFAKDSGDTHSDYGNWWWKDNTEVKFYNYWNAANNSSITGNTIFIKTVYDPSPRGFHIPLNICFKDIYGQNFPKDSGATYNNIYFTAEGYRDRITSSVQNFGDIGDYWTSDIYPSTNNSAYVLEFSPYSGNTRMSANAVPCKTGFGCSIKPVTEIYNSEESEEVAQYDNEIISENSESIEFDTEEPIISENITLGAIIPEGTEVENQ